MPQYVLQDLNARDPFVSTSTDFLLYDEKVILQSLWRLITTQEGEIPNFRVYGLDVKQFSQYPMTEETVNTIYNYVKSRVTEFEERAEIVRAEVDANPEQGYIYMSFYVRMSISGNTVKLPVWTVKVASA